MQVAKQYSWCIARCYIQRCRIDRVSKRRIPPIGPIDRPVRGIEVNTNGNLVRLPRDLLVQTSVDGAHWTTAFEDRPGGLVLIGALRLPRLIPLRLDLADVNARYVRVNTPAFRPGTVTIFSP